MSGKRRVSGPLRGAKRRARRAMNSLPLEQMRIGEIQRKINALKSHEAALLEALHSAEAGINAPDLLKVLIDVAEKKPGLLTDKERIALPEKIRVWKKKLKGLEDDKALSHWAQETLLREIGKAREEIKIVDSILKKKVQEAML